MRTFKEVQPRLNKLLAKRNWCEVWLATQPGSSRNTHHLEEYSKISPGDLVFSLRVEVGHADPAPHEYLQ